MKYYNRILEVKMQSRIKEEAGLLLYDSSAAIAAAIAVQLFQGNKLHSDTNILHTSGQLLQMARIIDRAVGDIRTHEWAKNYKYSGERSYRGFPGPLTYVDGKIQGIQVKVRKRGGLWFVIYPEVFGDNPRFRIYNSFGGARRSALSFWD